MKQLRRVVLELLAVSFISSCTPAFAQTPAPRLQGPITEASRTQLAGSRTPRVRDAQDLGAIAPDTVIPGITLVFKRSATQQAALDDLLAAQQNTASPLYHQWLTPDTFAARFGVADQDIATTESWLTSRGFHIETVARSRDRITFTGTAEQVQAAFGAELHHYRAEGEVHLAPASDLTLPAQLAPLTAAVLHLSDFRPKPSVKAGPAQPDYTAVSTQAHYLVPKDIATMYNLTPLYQKSGGLGQGLAVVGQSFVYTGYGVSSIGYFMQFLGVPNNIINLVLVPGSGTEAIVPGDEGESEIDLEYSSGTAPNASVSLVYVGSSPTYNVFDSLAFAITENIAPVVSISYGVCELALSANELDQDNALFQEAAAQGQTLVVATGDAGSTSCAYYTSAQGVTTAEQQSLAVDFPASSPYVTAVGGTQMAPGTFATGISSYWASATNIDNTNSLLSYVPEVVWNEDSVANGIGAAGGGSSAHFLRPSWQSAVPGIPAGAYRLLPDVALQSSLASPGFIICSTDPYITGLQNQTSSCNGGLDPTTGKFTIAGGTSFAAPIFAGFVAVLNGAEHTTGQGNINPQLYSLAANPTSYAAAFHDITSGTNACTPGIAVCSATGESNYQATVGYDEATGLGSVNFNALATAWPSSPSASLLPTSVLFSSTQATTQSGTTVPIQVLVQQITTGAVTAPTGTLSISLDGAVVNPSLALAPSTNRPPDTTATYNFVAPATAGSHLIVVAYSGDATHAPSHATYPILVGSVLATGTIGLSAPSLSLASNGTGSTQVTVTPGGGYSGTVFWSLSISGSIATTFCYSILPSSVNGATTAQLQMGTGTACSSAVPALRGQSLPLHLTATANNPPQPQSPGKTATAVSALFLCGLLAHRRRVRLPLLLVLVSFAIVGAGLTGCGSNGNSIAIAPSPTASYTVVLKATDSVNTILSGTVAFALSVD